MKAIVKFNTVRERPDRVIITGFASIWEFNGLLYHAEKFSFKQRELTLEVTKITVAGQYEEVEKIVQFEPPIEDENTSTVAS